MFGTGIVGLGNGDENGEGALEPGGTETGSNCFFGVACSQELSGNEEYLLEPPFWGSFRFPFSSVLNLSQAGMSTTVHDARDSSARAMPNITFSTREAQCLPRMQP
jgi:hypothetical protein